MMRAFLTFALTALASGLRYDPAFANFNLNQNQQATDPVDYSGSRPGHTYFPSPKSWRFPVYTLFLDRYANGDPDNDNANRTAFEQDITSNQLRHGGDVAGLLDSLDYIQGMGVKAIYIAGSPFMNLPWDFASYSPLDLTLLDEHFGDLKAWQDTVDAIHARGMFVILDHTFSTMGDLLAFKGFENVTAPFTISEHAVHYKTTREYLDFAPNNDYNQTCQYPRFWLETGFPAGLDVTEQLKGCYNSDFDQYGDLEAFGIHPDWQRSLAKFASVQDRLREWTPRVLSKLEVFSCLTVTMLDIDGFRYDKATQITVDALADHNEFVRQCAKNLGKDNFFLPGEITGGNNYGSIYIGRGRQPDQQPQDPGQAMNFTTQNSDQTFFIRDVGKNALDAAAFHYSVYRFLTRFLGMSGNLEAGFDLPPNWVSMWNQMAITNDLIDPGTGIFDPRHMMGTTNQDVFRWPAITQGIERMLLGLFITTLHIPGVPLLYYGEEQAFYVLDNTAENYIFGRQAMSSTPAWMLHGCHATNSAQYVNWPVNNAKIGCHDEAVSFDHRDPSHPVRNIIKSMYTMRENFPSLTDGWLLQPLSNKTDFTILVGSNTTQTERGIWSVARAFYPSVQGQLATDPVWLVYHNRDAQTDYSFICNDGDDGFIAPFTSGTTVKNLFYPYDEIILDMSVSTPLGFNGSGDRNGCVNKITMQPFEFRAYVAKSTWQGPQPMVTKFTPGHDAQINSVDAKGSVDISFEFSEAMDCDSITRAITVESSTEGTTGGPTLSIAQCTTLQSRAVAPYIGAIASNYQWSATLSNVADGVHRITLANVTNQGGTDNTRSTDHFLIRVGTTENPIVYPSLANYSKTLITREGSELYVNHNAAGADMWRYSTNWGSSYSKWTRYTGGKDKIEPLPWSGTPRQAWKGDHVIVQYFSSYLGSSSFMQQGDSSDQPARRFPHLFAEGDFNKFGFDGGLQNQMALTADGKWELHFMDEWPSTIQLNVWGMNPDGKPDATWVYGDVDSDMVLDRMPPSSLAQNVLNISTVPPRPALAYRMVLDDATLAFSLHPEGSIWVQIILFILLAVLPVVGGLLAVGVFMGSFYKVKINTIGFKRSRRSPFDSIAKRLSNLSREALRHKDVEETELGAIPSKRRKVIIATMEYNIDDWNIKIKIGGLGVMAQLMGKALEHQDLIWVVPCVGGIDYPIDQRAEPIYAPILGKEYEIQVQYHQVNNITYVLLDAPIFRQQTKNEPYPPRMDDIDSAIYYSAWNYCIAEACRRFDPDLYHINDYHGAAAPLHLLPHRTIPCAVSLHNAEFQGMWPMRNPEESKEVCEVFNLDPVIVEEYVQFGSVFNLLHAGASYLRVHQKGFGAVGVSKKYGDRSYARYPIFWGLSKIGQLPNPDPSDTADWNRDEELKKEDITIDYDTEAKRGDLRKQTQEWASLELNPNAELFVFVGRWSLQKGVDLIADIFPSILEEYSNTQLICIGPVIDLYGKFAALKLSKLMERYPKRVFSKPEFTQLPPYIFSGAEFALIPSRDEPFGLVAVEFGRKGALGVGARVGGLGQMPGFWYTIESTAPQHLLHQFREAIVSALESKKETRVKMRAWSAKQRFPVAQWVEDLDKLQSECIRIHKKEARKHKKLLGGGGDTSGARLTVPSNIDLHGTRSHHQRSYYDDSDIDSHPGSPTRSRASSISVPYIAYPGEDETDSDPRSISNPPEIRTNHSGGPPDEDTAFLPPNPILANQSARSSMSSLATVVPTEPGSRLSVDTFAMRMLSADPSETRPQAFGLYNPHAGPGANQIYQHRNSSRLSVGDVVGDRHDFKLQKVDPFFTDSTGEYYKTFEQKLAGLTVKNSDTELCIENFLKESEKEWFKYFRDAKLGRSRSPSRTRDGNLLGQKIRGKARGRAASVVSMDSLAPSNDDDDHEGMPQNPDRDDEFLLGSGYRPPKGLKKFLQYRVGDWPVYSFILALGQIVAANSYQIVLLSGEAGQTTNELYIVAGSYGVTSVLWWLTFRRFKSLYVLSLPWFFYGLGFVLLGVTPFMSHGARGAVQDLATALYATGASSGAMFFALNFGDEGGAPVMVWIFRAAIIQGIQQFYIVGLFYWGSLITAKTPTGTVSGDIASTSIPIILVIAVPIGLFLWMIGLVSFVGLPDYYQQSPDKIPSFYTSLLGRRIVPWFFLAVAVQNYFLSAPYGRNWQYLFSARAVPGWVMISLAFGFFGILWSLALWIFSHLSETHPWIVPLFAIGIGAPRWAQMLWGISGIGAYVPWAGSAVASAIVGRSLWLWLGLLDTIQGVGLGMVLLLTLTRPHVAATLTGAQILGSGFTILARMTAPDKAGPGDVFPDFSEGVMPGFGKPWFWVALGLQLILPVGFFKFFRKDQVAKP